MHKKRMTNRYDEMDLEGCNDNSSSTDYVKQVNTEKYKQELLSRTVNLVDGSLGFAHTYTIVRGDERWKCHPCDFIDGWPRFKTHLEGKNHQFVMNRHGHSRALFTKIVDAGMMPEIASGEPLPPGMEDVVTGTCIINEKLDNFPQPLIGLEFLLELKTDDRDAEPRYLCLMCSKRGDPRTIMLHLTSLSHYFCYLRSYFRTLYIELDKLPKSYECRPKVTAVTSHLIAKLQEKYGRLKPMAISEEVARSQEQKDLLLNKINAGIHFCEDAGDRNLASMLTIEYVEHPELLHERFPLNPKQNEKEKRQKRESRVNKSAIRGRADESKTDRESSPEVIFVSSSIKKDKDSDTKLIADLSPISQGSDLHIHSRSPSPRKYKSPPRRSRDRERFRPRGRRSRSRSRSRSNSYRYKRVRNSRGRSPVRFGDRSQRRVHSPRRNEVPYPRRYTKSRSRETRSPPYRKRPLSKSPSKRYGYSEKKRWEEYRKELDIAEGNLEAKLEYYKKNPEKHPDYQEEWKKFWNKRFKELMNEGKEDPNTYDYKPEWIDFWSVRMREIHEKNMTQAKTNLRTKLKLPQVDSKLDSSDLKDISSDEESITSIKSNSLSSISPESNKGEPTVMKNQWKGMPPRHEGPVGFMPPPRPWDMGMGMGIRFRPMFPPPEMFNPMMGFPGMFAPPLKKIMFDNPLNIITVLRQLAVLESQLGSMAPHILNMLTAGLSMEKAKPQSSVDLLTPENIVFLETVKEKLKGQLLASVVEKHLVKATLFSIKNIEELMLVIPKNKLKPAAPPPVPKPSSSLLNEFASASSYGYSSQVTKPVVDKVVIARQLAEALAAQGKTDLTQAELQGLVNETYDKIQAELASNEAKVANTVSAFDDENKSIAEKMEYLPEEELINVLKSFKELTRDEQQGLIECLKKLESTDPEKVSRLKMNVNFSNDVVKAQNQGPEEHKKEEEEDDDDNYSLEEVYKAASKNVVVPPKAEEEDEPVIVEKPKTPSPVLELSDELFSNIKQWFTEKGVGGPSTYTEGSEVKEETIKKGDIPMPPISSQISTIPIPPVTPTTTSSINPPVYQKLAPPPQFIMPGQNNMFQSKITGKKTNTMLSQKAVKYDTYATSTNLVSYPTLAQKPKYMSDYRQPQPRPPVPYTDSRTTYTPTTTTTTGYSRYPSYR